MGSVGGILGGGDKISVPEARQSYGAGGGIMSDRSNGLVYTGYFDELNPDADLSDPRIRAAFEQAKQRRQLVQQLRGTYSDLAGDLRGAIPGLQEAYQGIIDEYGNLLPQVTPGFGRLTNARVQAIDNARQRERSNLRSNLNQRRMLGSSFASRELDRQAMGFAQQEEMARAESFLAELDMTKRLLDDKTKYEISEITDTVNLTTQAAQAEAQSYGIGLDELNMFAQISNNVANNATELSKFNSNLAFDAAKMNAQSAAGSGSFFGNVLGTVGGMAGNAIGGPVGGAIASAVGRSAAGSGGTSGGSSFSNLLNIGSMNAANTFSRAQPMRTYAGGAYGGGFSPSSVGNINWF